MSDYSGYFLIAVLFMLTLYLAYLRSRQGVPFWRLARETAVDAVVALLVCAATWFTIDYFLGW